MSFYWSFFTTGESVRGRLNCWPIEPGSLVLTANDGVNPEKVITDNGDGTLGGDGLGYIRYDWGTWGLDFTDPVPNQGTEILASYTPIEGGCAVDCDKCASHYLRLDIVPDTISGSDDFTLADAWERLFKKIRRDILPIHLEILPETSEESYVLPIRHRFDIIPADEEALDEFGLRLKFDDTSW